MTDADIQRYEGLIFSTAVRFEGRVEGMDLDDLRQVFRIKVWRALESYDSRRSSLEEGRFVFGCLVNQGKDLLRRKKRGVLYIEDIAPEGGEEAGRRDRFEAEYLRVEAEEVFGLIENDEALIPNTLNTLEVRVLCLLYASFKRSEIARELDLSRREVSAAMDGITLKMADWSPGQSEELALAA